MARITNASNDDLVRVVEGPVGTPVQGVGVEHDLTVANLLTRRLDAVSDVAFATRVSSDSFDRLQILADGTIRTGNGAVAPLSDGDPLNDFPIPNVLESFSRTFITTTSITPITGQLHLTYFRCRVQLPISNVVIARTGTAPSVTPTLCRIGLYSVDSSSGDLTLVGSTANDTALFNGTNTTTTKALQATVTSIPGQLYALGLLCVQPSGTLPTFAGHNIAQVVSTVNPRLMGGLGSQTDLPATILGTDVVQVNQRIYSYFTT